MTRRVFRLKIRGIREIRGSISVFFPTRQRFCLHTAGAVPTGTQPRLGLDHPGGMIRHFGFYGTLATSLRRVVITLHAIHWRTWQTARGGGCMVGACPATQVKCPAPPARPAAVSSLAAIPSLGLWVLANCGIAIWKPRWIRGRWLQAERTHTPT